MRLTRLRLANFRNHRATEVLPAPGITLFVGANAQGKTSILEAVQVAATGRSLRAQHDAEMISLGEAWARLRVLVERAGREEEIDVALRREEISAPGGSADAAQRAVREIRVNGVPVRRGELFGRLLCVGASPDDAEIITGAPRYRRRLLDLLLAQISPSYYDTLQRYGRVLVQRNRLLRSGSLRGLDAWDEQLATIGAAMTMRRRGMVGRLAAAAAPSYTELSGGREALRLTFVPSLSGDDETAMASSVREAVAARRAEELARGVTVVGPHRDDLSLQVDGRDLRIYGSRGQQMAAMLAVRLAERRVLREETGEEPVLLFDDVLLTLDGARQAYLLDVIRGVQVLFTVTTLATLSAVPEAAAVFRVEGGTVARHHAHLA